MMYEELNKNMELEEHVLKKYEIKKRLGKGAYGIVWKAIERKSKEIVALKKIFDAFQNQVDAQRTYREIMFLKAFGGHPNIIKLKGLHRACNNKDIYLVFEYMDTDLHKVIQNKNILKDIHKRFIMYQLLNATYYMHSGNVIHRDQKPSNILLDSNCQCKIADFGLARSLHQLEINEENGDPALTDYVATRWYRAPEILIGSTRYTKGIDMWSLGCILAEMLLERPLFPGGSSVKQLELIMRTLPAPTPDDMRTIIKGFGGSKLFSQPHSLSRMPSLREVLRGAPLDAIDLVERLLVLNPERRLTAQEALQHEYVSQFYGRGPEISCLNEPVLPPLSDNTMLSVDEYRDKLYEMASAPSTRKTQQQSSVESSTSHKKHSNKSATKSMSLDEKNKQLVKSKNLLAPPPADWPDRRASLPKRFENRADYSQQQASIKTNNNNNSRPHPMGPIRKASLPIIPNVNRSPQHLNQPAAPERAKLGIKSQELANINKYLNQNLTKKKQFGNKGNQSFLGITPPYKNTTFNIRNNNQTRSSIIQIKYDQLYNELQLIK